MHTHTIQNHTLRGQSERTRTHVATAHCHRKRERSSRVGAQHHIRTKSTEWANRFRSNIATYGVVRLARGSGAYLRPSPLDSALSRVLVGAGRGWRSRPFGLVRPPSRRRRRREVSSRRYRSTSSRGSHMLGYGGGGQLEGGEAAATSVVISSSRRSYDLGPEIVADGDRRGLNADLRSASQCVASTRRAAARRAVQGDAARRRVGPRARGSHRGSRQRRSGACGLVPPACAG